MLSDISSLQISFDGSPDLNCSQNFPELNIHYNSESVSDCSHISNDDSDDQTNQFTIPTQIGHRPPKVNIQRPPPSWRTIRRDNKAIQALTLPRACNFNMRALFPKLNHLSEDMIERECDISFLTEVWEKKENKKQFSGYPLSE